MERQQPFTFKPWMTILFLIGVIFLILNYDPVGNLLNQWFGPGGEKWATNIFLLCFLFYAVFIIKNPPANK